MLRAFALVLALLTVATPVMAQSPARWEVSGGYALLNDPQIDVVFRRGWIAGVAAPLKGPLSIVGEAAGIHAAVESIGDDARLAAHSILGGLRVSAALGRVHEFVQLLAGDARGSGSLFGVSDARHAIAIQPGIGLDVPLTRHLAARGQVDVRWIRGQRDGVDRNRQLRLVAAMVYSLRE